MHCVAGHIALAERCLTAEFFELPVLNFAINPDGLVLVPQIGQSHTQPARGQAEGSDAIEQSLPIMQKLYPSTSHTLALESQQISAVIRGSCSANVHDAPHSAVMLAFHFVGMWQSAAFVQRVKTRVLCRRPKSRAESEMTSMLPRGGTYPVQVTPRLPRAARFVREESEHLGGRRRPRTRNLLIRGQFV